MDGGSRFKARQKNKSRRENVSSQRENEEVATNRLVTRALYDTEEEEVITCTMNSLFTCPLYYLIPRFNCIASICESTKLRTPKFLL